MAFPITSQLRGSFFLPLDDPDLYIAGHGEAKTHTTFTEQPGTFTALFRGTAAELEEWEDHCDANRRSADSFIWQEDNSSHSCYWDGPPNSSRLSQDLFEWSVTLRVAT